MEVKKGYKLTEVGVIPEDWNCCELGAVSTMKSGKGITSERINLHSEFPCYGGNGIRGFTDTITHNGAYGLIGRQGALCGNVQLVNGKFFASEHAVVVTANKKTDIILLSYILGEMNLNQYSESSAQPGLSVGKILKLSIPLPPTKAEQEAIAEALSDVDGLIESLEDLIAKKRLVKQGAMQELLTGKKRLPGFEGAWEEKRLGDVGKFLKGSGITKDQANSGEIPCVRYGEIYTRHDYNVKNYYSHVSPQVAATAQPLKKGDLLFAGSGETREEIGKCVAFLDGFEAYAGGDIVILRPGNVDSQFMGYLLNTSMVNEQKASKGQGDAVVHISGNALASILINVPILEEQIAIGNVLTDIDEEISVLETKLTKARQIKEGMMQELLTGKTRLV